MLEAMTKEDIQTTIQEIEKREDTWLYERVLTFYKAWLQYYEANERKDPEISYIADGCYKWTFDAFKVKRFVEDNCKGEVLNLFAGKNRLRVKETRVDSSNKFFPDYCMSAKDFIELARRENFRYDTIIWDPPWNERKSKEYYEGRYIGKFTKLKNDVTSLLNDNGIIISLGYEITNFGKSRGMDLIKVVDVDPKGEIRPYFISIEKKRQTLEKFLTSK